MPLRGRATTEWALVCSLTVQRILFLVLSPQLVVLLFVTVTHPLCPPSHVCSLVGPYALLLRSCAHFFESFDAHEAAVDFLLDVLL